jgi:hypothetical protein
VGHVYSGDMGNALAVPCHYMADSDAVRSLGYCARCERFAGDCAQDA